MEKSAIHILVIDDEAKVCDLIKLFFTSEGYSVDTALSGAEGLEMLVASSYNVVICDLKMSGMNGIETLERIKACDQSVEVILVTGYSSVETAVKCMKKGAFDYITKPFNLAELENLVKWAAERRHMQTLVGLHEVSKLIFSTIKFDELLNMIIQLAGKALGADDASLMLFDDEKKLYIAACSGLDCDVVRQTKLEICEGIAGRIAREKKPIILQDSIEDYEEFKDIKGQDNTKSAIVYPIITRDKVIGILNVKRTKVEKPFSEHDLMKAAIFVSHIAQAIENANLYRELECKVEELDNAYADLEAKQEQLIISEKLSALGNMTAGLAHEINNPLTVIMGFTEHLKQSNNLTEEGKSILEKIYLSTVRCRRIIKNLFSFTRTEGSGKQNLQLLDILKDMVEFKSHEMKLNNIQFVANLPENLSIVNGNSDMLRQVILSIISNAVHSVVSFHGAGRIEIKARVEGEKVVLRFIDDGKGISKENISKIFDPFFTTKKVGEGTGLGLSACYGILRDHGGSIYVKSIEGEGAEFTIELPVSQFSPVESEEYTSIDDKKISRVKKILVIDDEDFILDLCREILERNGYQVVTVNNGKEGLEQIISGCYDLIILDWRMPGTDGKEIYERVLSHDAEIAQRIIFVTGDIINFDKLEFLDNEEQRFLSKPFKVNEFIEMVQHFETKKRIVTMR